MAFYALFANIPYWFISHEFGFSPLGWFCIQYVTVGLLALVLPGSLSASLLFVIISADIFSGICLSYFLPIRECLQNIGVAREFSGERIFCVVAGLLLVLLATATAGSLSGNTLPKNHRLCAAGCLLAIATTSVSVDLVSRRLMDGRLPTLLSVQREIDRRDLRFSKFPRLVRYPVLRLAKIEIVNAIMGAAGNKNETPARPVQSAAVVGLRNAGLMQGGMNRESPNLVLIVVESWGLANASPLQEALVQSYRQPSLLTRYEVVQGTVPFDGTTIPAEARELCGSSFGYQILQAPKSELKGCLPGRFAGLGYSSIALHGMNGLTFNRS
ncbi:MAG: hypothetical protein WBC92_02470, partial [Terracidiphilus sp.]